LPDYAYPVFGNIAVGAIDTGLVLKVLESVWKAKTETASRVRSRIENVLDWAKVRGYRQGDNPARWKGHLDKLLPAPAKVRKPEHHAAMPYAELPAFMAELRAREGIAAVALEFTILTATRAGEVLGATWDEIDLAAKVWVIPGVRMKAGREHRIPLSVRTVQLLAGMPHDQDLIFPVSSNKAMQKIMHVLRPGYVPHGFRSTFRDWAAEQTGYPNHVVEQALAHAIGDKVEAAYRRGDLFEKRRRLMAEWARYCATEPTGATVVPIRKA